MTFPEQKKSSLRPDGSRPKIRPADVKGKFTTYRHVVFYFLIAILVSLPFLKLHGKPVILLDIVHRQFFLFGKGYNAQDFYLVFFLFTGAGFGLIYLTSLLGRVWCGWACPQTVFLEGVFRRIERWIEGPASAQSVLASGPWNRNKISKFVLKHSIYIVLSFALSIVFLSYFIPREHLDISSHPIAIVWMCAMSGAIYFNFAYFREQTCLIVCPYGRLQSALIDNHSVIIGYDEKRGEPRGKVNDEKRGDCISCQRCVAVCPTGIDIRAGLQMECVGCANCIDACDEIMLKVGQKPGLIRYDSLNGLKGFKTHLIRPRTILYTVLLFIGIFVASYFFSSRHNFEANVLRLPGIPYVLEGEKIRNQFTIHLFNKSTDKKKFIIMPSANQPYEFVIPQKEIELESMNDKKTPFSVSIENKSYNPPMTITIEIRDQKTGESIIKQSKFLGP